MNKLDNLPDYGNILPIRLHVQYVILNISLIVEQNLPDCKMQMLAALYKVNQANSRHICVDHYILLLKYLSNHMLFIEQIHPIQGRVTIMTS